MINSRIYFLRDTSVARERGISLCRGSLSKSTMFQGGGDRCLRRPLGRIVICALAKQSLSYNVMRDEITIDVYFLDSRFFFVFFVLASRCEFAIQLLSKHRTVPRNSNRCSMVALFILFKEAVISRKVYKPGFVTPEFYDGLRSTKFYIDFLSRVSHFASPSSK